MDDSELDRLLAPRDGVWQRSPLVLEAMLDRAEADARHRAAAENARARRRRMAFLGTGLLAAAIAATAGASAVIPTFEPDAVIPIEYTTVTGRHVECRFMIAASSWGESSVDDVKEWITQHDWTGIGQKGYDFGTANPVELGEPGTDPALTQEAADRLTVQYGIGTMVVEEIPEDLLSATDVGTIATSDCRWERY